MGAVARLLPGPRRCGGSRSKGIGIASAAQSTDLSPTHHFLLPCIYIQAGGVVFQDVGVKEGCWLGVVFCVRDLVRLGVVFMII